MQITSSKNGPDESKPLNDKISSEASSQSFSNRMQIETSRRIVGSYRDSQLGASFLPIDYKEMKQKAHFKPRSEVKDAPPMNRQAINAGEQYDQFSRLADSNSRQKYNNQLKIPNRQAFHEPQPRGYNPYQ